MQLLTLGYDKFRAWKLGYDSEEREYEDLIISIKDKDIEIKKILTILANALEKIAYIKSNQSKIYKEMSELDYYYQNFQFHIYTTRNYSNQFKNSPFPQNYSFNFK